MVEPRFSVSEFSTLNLSFEQDVAAYAVGGAKGIGLAEVKLPEGRDAESRALLRDAGLAATICLPAIISILPIGMSPEPQEPEARVESLKASIRRLAAFEPSAVMFLTGVPGDLDPAEARRIAVEGAGELSRAGREAGVRVMLEPIHRSAADEFCMVSSLPEAIELLDEVGEPLDILFDTWHLWDTPNVVELACVNAHRFPSVHINDWRNPTRGWDDRVLPGDGVIDLPAIFGALEAGGFDGWYDLEIFSTETYEDSLLKLDPIELVRRGMAGFLKAWEARHM